ncbi:MAG: L-aspartate oxidase [Actinomycetales bacterium]|nr:L-aspartate oxidase [Actinomycetales bacterium]
MKKLVVIGSGIAGLVAAVEASRTHEVVLVTKSVLAESNTHYAQGGIAAVTSTEDSIAEHVADTLAAGADYCYEPAVRVLCEDGPARINDLVNFGVEFDRNPDGTDWALGLEAAHSHARILHAGGDTTGADISNALVRAVRTVAADIHEHTFVSDIVLGSAGQVVGVELIDAAGKHVIECDAVILASGGAGQLYRHTTNPAVTTGDGVAAAFRAGAELADVEFYQFHPTALAVPGSFLISEAVRGEGAVLLNKRGERFMQKLHPLAELAPRDVVARGIQSEMLAQGGQPVLLDATGLGAEFLAKRFPSISAATKAYGLDWGRTPIPVTPAAHYWMGGVATDIFGRTSVPGLFAVGEVACTGAHGANRLASNSLLESIVFSHRAVSVLNESWPKEASAVRFNEQGILAEIELADPSSRTAADGATAVVDRVELQTLMWDNVGLARSGELLSSTRHELARWRPAAAENRLFTDWEDANLLVLATAVTEAALARTESRGGHFRLDYPATNPLMAKPITIVRKAR